MAINEWGTDVPVSSPEIPNGTIRVRFGGFAFTTKGIVHDITESDREEIFTPYYAPEDFGKAD